MYPPLSNVILSCNIPKFYSLYLFMRKTYFTIGIMAILLLSSFKKSKACEYAGSNINFVKIQTEKALGESDLNKARFFTYKALNAIEKSKSQFSDCGCEDANLIIEEGLENLKKATRTTTLAATRILLNRALENTLGSLDALENHEMHNNLFSASVLEMNTIEASHSKLAMKIASPDALYKKIDESLENYERSLSKIVESVNCKEARAYAERVYAHCEGELLKSNLSEGKKYYNLRTKEITVAAMDKLMDCR